ncbi:uncharacterized protein LOC127662459 isoform X2 [Xyrauchen texanus]|nr:uncharacterized protein LOC127662459 isoform X2 [Xyrauchen texanus]
MVLVLGLMLVLIADWIWPSRPKRKDNKTVLTVKEDVSDEEVEDILSEYKRTSDLDNESERADESIEEEGQITDSYSELPPPEGAAENSARKRNLQETNTSEGT